MLCSSQVDFGQHAQGVAALVVPSSASDAAAGDVAAMETDDVDSPAAKRAARALKRKAKGKKPPVSTELPDVALFLAADAISSGNASSSLSSASAGDERSVLPKIKRLLLRGTLFCVRTVALERAVLTLLLAWGCVYGDHSVTAQGTSLLACWPRGRSG